MSTAFIPGFLLGFSLIVAIGAQNAFVLRHGDDEARAAVHQSQPCATLDSNGNSLNY